MADREKVIKELQGLSGSKETMKLISDAIALLKEQETAKAALKVLSDRQCEVSPHYYERKGFCPKCHQEVKLILNRNYCGFCGQALKWKEGEI